MAEKSNLEYPGKTTEGGHKHLLDQSLAQGKLQSEANFWLDMAKGALPAASEAIDFRSGETWGALGQGAALGIGLSWMTNKFRPAPVRVIGGIINAGMAVKFAWDSGQTVGQVIQLKDKAIGSGNYASSVHEAQKLTGKFVADGAIGVLGAHIGFVGEHGINHAWHNWSGKPRLAATVPVGEMPASIHGNKNTVEESPYYLAMSKNRKNKKDQKWSEQKPLEAKVQPKVESTKPVEPTNTVEAEQVIDAQSQLRLLEEQAIRKGKPAAPETFENLQALKQERDRELFRANKTETAEQVLSHVTEKETKLLAELEAIQNHDYAYKILDAAEKSPYIADLFLEARSGKYPDDSHVVFVDDKGRLIRYSYDYVADRTLYFPIKDIGRGVADFELMSHDIVQGAAIFGPSRGGDRPLLGVVGDVPAKLADCGNYREFFLKTRLDKNLSQFDFRTGFKQPLGGEAKCKGGVCELTPDFRAKLQASKEGVLSQKSDTVTEASPNVAEPVLKLADTIDIVEPTLATPRGGDEPLVMSEKADPLAELAIKENALLDKLATHEDRLKRGEIKDINRQLRDIKKKRERLGFAGEEKATASDVDLAAAESPVVQAKTFDDTKIREMLETETEARLQGLPEGVYGRVSELEPGFKKQVHETHESAIRDARVRQEIETEARLQGLPEGVYGRVSEFKPGFKARFDEARNNYFERVAQERKNKQAAEKTPGQSETFTQSKFDTESKSETQSTPETQAKPEHEKRAGEEKPQAREKKFFTQDDHDAMEVDLRLENKFLADAFRAARNGSKSRPGDKVVFFVKDGNDIARASLEDARGFERSMSTKVDFHFGNVPVDLLKNEVIGWARAIPKIREGKIEYRQNARQGGNNKPQPEFEFFQVDGEVPAFIRQAVEEKRELSQRELNKVPDKIFSKSKGADSGNATVVDTLRKVSNNIKHDLDKHNQSVAKGVDEGRLAADKVDQLKIKLEKIEREIAENERAAETTGAEKQSAKPEATSKLEAEDPQTTKVLDKDALDPAQPREMKAVSSEKLSTDIIRQLDSWKLQSDRPKIKPNDIEPVFTDKAAALKHVAYNVHSRARELFVQGKAAEAEGWAISLKKLVDAGATTFTAEERIKAYSLLGEIFRVQNKNGAAENCLKWTLEDKLLSDQKIQESEQLSLLKAGLLESYAKLLRSEFSQERIQKARDLEAQRREILDGMRQNGHNPNADSTTWDGAPVQMRDLRTGKISMENNAKYLDRSLKILNWFDIKL